ncbi:Aste57867_3794 [Aphanomyces stellatus]|uniref:Aste57867_3794 protein n=1 Tax=Aphanomyces stellatus TaxID=120398 RepID=A0A485KE90_9STRA|nr:hypothetical protein As57867_003783 [Aphanomyces stellatus]VFT80944.1 Aste57867_3794 [Aphanomyces stellatus]
MALDTLPRFEQHALGKGWAEFKLKQAKSVLLSNVVSSIEHSGESKQWVTMDHSRTSVASLPHNLASLLGHADGNPYSVKE